MLKVALAACELPNDNSVDSLTGDAEAALADVALVVAELATFVSADRASLLATVESAACALLVA